MDSTRRTSRWWWTLGLGALLATSAGAEEPPVKHTPTQRMAPDRLRATHEDAERFRATRRDLPPIPGLNDYRAIFHAHAEDSAHTGGTRPEMLVEAKAAGVHAIFLSDHHRPPRDFVTESWRGLRDGVLFVPGSEARGFLLVPSKSILDKMDAPVPDLLAATREGGGLAFLSHVEERPDHPMDGLDGQEIYNRHADAKDDKAGLLALILALTDPDATARLAASLERFPDELFAFQVEYPAVYLAKWDRETPRRRLTGVAANDCHHNNVLIVKKVDDETVRVGTNVDRDDQMRVVKAALRPGIRALTRGRAPGDILARVDLDPYRRAFRNVCTHVLAPELTEPALRDAIRAGRVYVSHDWIADPTGFRFAFESPDRKLFMGDEAPIGAGGTLSAAFPAPCRIRLIRDGEVVAEAQGDRLDHRAEHPGVYRVEARVRLDGEDRPWIYSNPIYLR
ncbi:MAG: histidinol phosphatase [Isosphaeraceae bacterium]